MKKDFSNFVHSVSNVDFAKTLADKIVPVNDDEVPEELRQLYVKMNSNALNITLAVLRKYHEWVSE